MGGESPLEVFWISAFILVREGFEAMVVIAALLAALKKLEQRSSAHLVHWGWASALAVGAPARPQRKGRAAY